MSATNPDTGVLAVQAICADLVVRSAGYTDSHDHEAFAGLFAPDARLTRPGGEPLVGREAILASYRAKPAERLTRHLVTNTRFTELSGDSASAISYVLLWSSSTAEPIEAFGRKAAPRQVLGEFHDRFAKTGQGWRIAERRASFIMYSES